MVLRDGLASSSSQLDAYFLLWDAGLLFFRPCSDEETDYSLYPDSRAFGHNGHYGCSQGYVFFCNDTFLKMTTEKDSKAKAAKRQLFKVHILIQRAKSGHPFLSTVRFFPTSQTLRLSREPRYPWPVQVGSSCTSNGSIQGYYGLYPDSQAVIMVTKGKAAAKSMCILIMMHF